MNQITLYQQTMPSHIFDESKIELLKNTICKGSTDEEFELFIHACKRTGLDPFMRQIYAVKRWDSSLKRESMTIQTGIDGYRLIAERTGKYSPGREPTYQYDGEGKIISATAYVKKQTTDGTWHEIAATAFFNEYCQRTKEGKPTRFWMQMAHTMLAKCAEALALRKAFPGDLSGLYTKEEMQQAEIEEIVTKSCRSQDVEKLSQPIHVENIPDAGKMVQPTLKSTIDHIEQSLDMMQHKPQEECITENQWKELMNLISSCDDKFQETTWSYLESQQIFSSDKMPLKLYMRIKKGCKQNMEKRELACV